MDLCFPPLPLGIYRAVLPIIHCLASRWIHSLQCTLYRARPAPGVSRSRCPQAPGRIHSSSLSSFCQARLPSPPAAPAQVISCAASDAQDVVLKKSLYQYITSWAAANPELMLLTINMLLKDCGDQDPTIRGLALRSLCSLRIANLTEYLVSEGEGDCGLVETSADPVREGTGGSEGRSVLWWRTALMHIEGTGGSEGRRVLWWRPALTHSERDREI